MEYHDRLPPAMSKVRPLRLPHGAPVPPLTGALRAGLIGAFLGQVLLLSVAGMHNRFVLESDALVYMRLAWYYATGQFHLAVSGAWGPLLSWLMIPWLGWTGHLLDAARIAMGLSAVVFVGGCVAMFRSLALPPAALLVGTWLVALATVFWSVEYITPDLLMSGLFGLALGRMLQVRWCTSRLTPWLTGMLCGCAYLAKAIALPATVTCSVGVGLLWAVSYRLPWRQVSRSVALTWLGCALVAGPWIAVLSWKYRTPTFSTAGAIAHAISGPHDVERGHPDRRMFHRPEAGRLFAFEEPSVLPYAHWSPLANRAYAQHQLLLMYTNYRQQLTILRDFDVLGLGLLALGSSLLVPGHWRRRLQREPWRWAIVPVVGLVVWYLPVYARSRRYYFLTYPLVLTASLGLVWSLTQGCQRWRRTMRWGGLLLVSMTFALTILAKLPRAVRGLEAPSVLAQSLATKLQAAHVSGPLAGVGTKDGLFVAFFLQQPWYGEEQHPTMERLNAAQATLYVIARQAPVLEALEADPAWRNLAPVLFTSTAEAHRYPWHIYQRLAP